MRYLPIDFPDAAYLLLVDDNGVADGPFETATFARLDDGSYVASTPGHPVVLRCVRREGSRYVCVDQDGHGDEFRYLLVPYRDGTPSGAPERGVSLDDQREPATPHIVAIDWSGAKGARETIWLAEVDHDGQLETLSNGRSREQTIEYVVQIATAHPRTVVGLDFAFGFPAWWTREQGYAKAEHVWTACSHAGEDWLTDCPWPFWGRPARPNPHTPKHGYRDTDKNHGYGQPKSVFQIGGAGAVGTGSVRGMPMLNRIAAAGGAIWPFHPAANQASLTAIEIYPRSLTGNVDKGRWSARVAYMDKRFPDQTERFRERAAGSEDAFDAAVSALVMHAHRSALAQLPVTTDPGILLEGQIWIPPPE